MIDLAKATTAPRPQASAVQPVSVELAKKALSALDRDAAVAKLEEAYTLIDRLQQELSSASTQLEASKAREADLLEVLGRWQARQG